MITSSIGENRSKCADCHLRSSRPLFRGGASVVKHSADLSYQFKETTHCYVLVHPPERAQTEGVRDNTAR